MLAALVFCMLPGCGKNDKVPTGTIESGVDYDVIVVGGDPEGVCAAVSSARNGLKTLLIEDDAALGGLMTLGKLNFTRRIFQHSLKPISRSQPVQNCRKFAGQPMCQMLIFLP